MEDSLKESDLSSSSSGSYAEEGGRGCRNKKRLSEPICCPVCQLTLRVSEVQSHLTLEVDKLRKLPITKLKQNGRNLPSSSHAPSDNDKPWETYQKVRLNRQNRHRSKTRKRRAEEVVCPICNKETMEEITLHVEKCLRRSDRDESGSDESIDVEAYEEYEWAGQSRVRLTTLIPGGVTNLGLPLSQTEEDEDLNVDGDDTQIYGSPQYTETDIYRLPSDGGDEVNKWPSETAVEQSWRPSGNSLVEALKIRIKELESRGNKGEVYKCLICMERYRTPVISVCCWHVHCEECWLQTLGAKKLCPQCNMITTATDLRRIYM